MTPVAVETAAEQTFEFGPLHHSTRVAATSSWGGRGWTSTGAAIRASAQAEPG